MGKRIKHPDVEEDEIESEEDYNPKEDAMDIDDEDDEIDDLEKEDDPEFKSVKKDEDDYVMKEDSDEEEYIEEEVEEDDDNDNEEESKTITKPKEEKSKSKPQTKIKAEPKPKEEAKSKTKLIKSTNPVKVVKKVISKKDSIIHLLDPLYDIEENYFYKPLPESEWNNITKFIKTYLNNSENNAADLQKFFNAHPNIIKAQSNIIKLHDIIDKLGKDTSAKLISYQSLNNYYITNYLTPKPAVLQCYFFPNISNEIKVTNMLRTCKKSLDIAIFTLTNDKIAAAIQEAYTRGVKVRIIADDECCKMWGSDVDLLASIGIACKTDNAVKFHMHHKFAILDNQVIITGSFNWTMQAVKFNQENILFYDNQEIAQQYTDEYNRLWTTFVTVIDQKEALKRVTEEKEKKRIEKEKREKEKEKKRLIKEKEKAVVAKEKAKVKLKKDKVKEAEKENIRKEKEKAKNAKEKEKMKIAKEKEKTKLGKVKANK